jgi:hypothetical protein
MFEEKNTKSNLPAQIEIYEEGKDSYKFLFIAKGVEYIGDDPAIGNQKKVDNCNEYQKFVDTLNSEPWIPASPKPSKAPKANPSEPVSLPVLGSLGTLGVPPIKNESRFIPPRVRPCHFQRGPFGMISRLRALPSGGVLLDREPCE